MAQLRPAGWVTTKSGFLSVVAKKPTCANNPVFVSVLDRPCQMCGERHDDFLFQTVQINSTSTVYQVFSSSNAESIGLLIYTSRLDAEQSSKRLSDLHFGSTNSDYFQALTSSEGFRDAGSVAVSNGLFVYDPFNHASVVISAGLTSGDYDIYARVQEIDSENCADSILILRSDVLEADKPDFHRSNKSFNFISNRDIVHTGKEGLMPWDFFWREFSPRFQESSQSYFETLEEIAYSVESATGEEPDEKKIWTLKPFGGALGHILAIFPGIDRELGIQFIVTEKSWDGFEHYAFGPSSVTEFSDDWFGIIPKLDSRRVTHEGLESVRMNFEHALLKHNLNPTHENLKQTLSWLLQEWCCNRFTDITEFYLHANDDLRTKLFGEMPVVLDNPPREDSLGFATDAPEALELFDMRWLPKDSRQMTLHAEGA